MKHEREQLIFVLAAQYFEKLGKRRISLVVLLLSVSVKIETDCTVRILLGMGPYKSIMSKRLERGKSTFRPFVR